MKPMKSTFLMALLLACSIFAEAQEKYSRVKIHAPQDRARRAELIGLLQIDHFGYAEDGALISEISTRDLEALKRTGYRYEVLEDDVAAALVETNRAAVQSKLPFEQTGNSVLNIIPTPAAFQVKATLGGYYSFPEMVAAMDALIAAYGTGPNKIAKKFSLGQTAGGRDLWCIKISDNVDTDEDEPEVLFMGLQHAREAIGGSSMIMMMQYLCENYATNIRVKELVDNREVFIIVCMNPDGWEYNRSTNPNGGGMWRKNRNGNGVDLNRNWSVDWGNCSAPITGAASSCGSNNSTAETYYGPYAFSELETQHVANFARTHHLVAMVDQHAFGPYYSLPFGRPSLPGNSMSAEDAAFYTYVPAAMGKYNGMRAGNSPESVGYEVAGGVKDWMLKGEIATKGKVYGMTGEGGYGTTGYTGSFWAPSNSIITLCKGMVYQNLQLLAAAGPMVHLQDNSDIILSAKTGSLSYRATRVGIKNADVHVSIVPIENIYPTSFSMVPATSTPNYYDSYVGTINYTLHNAIVNGQRIRFAWKVQAGGVTYYDTVTKYYHPTPASLTLMQDNMDAGTASTNWAITGSWGYTSTGTGKDGVGRALSESPSGLYPNGVTGTNSVARWNNAFDLSTATSAHISFWVRHRAENFRDKLQLQVSRNSTTGTNGTWTPIVGTTTVQEPGTLDGSSINGQPALTGIRELWTRELYDLKDYVGAGNGSVRFRFVFTSDASTTSGFDYRQDDGFYIDDIKLVRSTVALVTLPVRFLSFTGKLLADETIQLNWDATTDQMHDRFEVEKSADGSRFVLVGTGPARGPYSLIDPTPYIGNNYYRIKQFDKDGSVSYSAIVNVPYTPSKFGISIFPNPVKESINVKINSTETTPFVIAVTDFTGRKVYEQKIVNSFTDRVIKIPFSQQASGLYVVTVRNDRNEVVATEKVTKQ